MVSDAIAVAAARNYRSLGRRGIPIRKTIDMLIARGASKTVCRCSTTTAIFARWSNTLG
jgi:predicted nucleic acid-binding protein